MMDDRIKAILKKYDLDSSAVWEVRQNAFAIHHSAVETIACREKIVFDLPTIIHDGLNEKDSIVIMVVGRKQDRTEWSFGECSPKNNKNQYPWAMAEKRAKDRVVLKLIDAHGLLYSDTEADDLERKRETKARARSDYDRIQAEIDASDSVDALEILYRSERLSIQNLPQDWEEEIINRFSQRKKQLIEEMAKQAVSDMT